MKLREMWQPALLLEGGNLNIGDATADRIDSTKRAQVVPLLQKFITSLNVAYDQSHDEPIWNDSVIASGQHLAGSSFHFFNRPEITDEIFAGVKRTVGDIDLKVDSAKSEEIKKWLNSLSTGARIGPALFVGVDDKDPEQVLTLWQFPDIVITDKDQSEKAINIQIDLEMKDYKDGKPTDWAGFSTSSAWEDLSEGIKGVFHKFLIQSLSVLTKQEFVLQKYRKVRGKDEYNPSTRQTVEDSMVSFAVKSKEGGGLRLKYEPVIDASTGEQETEDGLPVFKKRPTTGYQKDITEIFYQLFNGEVDRKTLEQRKRELYSFVGLLNMVKNVLPQDQQLRVAQSFSQKLFGERAQGLYKKDPDKDREEKTIAMRKLIDVLETKPEDLDQMISDYYAAYKTENLDEAVATSRRKGVVHLEKMRDIDFLEFVQEIQNKQGNGFDLANIKMTTKIDGLGGRFGKDSNGEPFFESSRSGPIKTAGAFSAHMQKQGVDDPDKLARAEKYDSLFDDIMDLIDDVDRELGEDFLNNVKVHCEILYVPMATETAEGKLQYVSMEYDRLADGVELAVVPLFVEQADTGEDHTENDTIKQQLNQLGRLGNAEFIDNSILQQGSLDVTTILEPLENIEELKSVVQSRKRKGPEAERKQEIKNILDTMKQQIAQEVIDNPNIVGKYRLGDDYEGVILYTEKGPVKVTSPKFKELMKKKQDVPAGSGKAVVAYGNLMGHRGHQLLVDATLKMAEQQGRKPFVYISPMVGPDDPVSAETKQKTFQKLYPAHKQAFRIVGSGADAKGVVRSGGIRGAIKFDLVPEGFTDIVVVTGEDQKDAFRFLTTDRARKSMGVDSVETVTRQDADSGEEGVRSTQLRNILTNPDLSYEQKVDQWMQGFDGKRLGRDWIEKIIAEAAKNMSLDLKANSKQKESIMKQPELREYINHLENIIGDRLNEMTEAPENVEDQVAQVIQGIEEFGQIEVDIDPGKFDQLMQAAQKGDFDQVADIMNDFVRSNEYAEGDAEAAQQDALEEIKAIMGSGSDLKKQLAEILKDLQSMAQQGEDVTDMIADELGDLFDAVQSSDNRDIQKVYRYVREKLADRDPQDQAKGLQIALKTLGSTNENTFEDEDNEDEDGEEEPVNRGFSQEPMMAQLGKVLDSQDSPKPVNTVTTDDGETFEVSSEQAEALRLLGTTQKVKPEVRQAFANDIQTSNGITDFLDQPDYHDMADLFVKRYLA